MFDLFINYLNKKLGTLLVVQIGLGVCAVSGMIAASVIIFQAVLPMWAVVTMLGLGTMATAFCAGVLMGFGILFLRED